MDGGLRYHVRYYDGWGWSGTLAEFVRLGNLSMAAHVTVVDQTGSILDEWDA